MRPAVLAAALALAGCAASPRPPVEASGAPAPPSSTPFVWPRSAPPGGLPAAATPEPTATPPAAAVAPPPAPAPAAPAAPPATRLIPVPVPVPVFRSAAPAATSGGYCSRERPCVGPRGGLYYIGPSGGRVYLSRR